MIFFIFWLENIYLCRPIGFTGKFKTIKLILLVWLKIKYFLKCLINISKKLISFNFRTLMIRSRTETVI